MAPPEVKQTEDSEPNKATQDGSVIFYVGQESLALSTVLMTNALNEVCRTRAMSFDLTHAQTYSYDPLSKTARAESSRTNAVLARRYALVHKARRADVFGIVVGTLGVGLSRHHTLLNFF